MLLTSILSGSNHTKCMSLSNQKSVTQPTLIKLHPNEYNQELCCYPSAVNLDGCFAICSIVNELSSRVYIPNKTEDLNLHVFNTIPGING